jgi:hypothetical protein
MTLVFKSMRKTLQLPRTKVLLEVIRLQELRSLGGDLIRALIMLAWRDQGAFWASLVVN